MLNQHHNLIIPLSDWLKIGDCVLDVPRREISAPQRATPLRITVKAQQVLMVLVSHQGKVVSREAIIEWVWPDTLPTDDVLTQAITQLRKAFCDDRDAPRYLETIAKGGYRLLAPIHWLASDDSDAEVLADYVAPGDSPTPLAGNAPAATPALQVQPARRANYAVMTLVALTAVAVGIGVLLARRPDEVARAPVPVASPQTPAVASAEYQRITSLPGSEFWPSVSPDGSQVVYSAFSEDGETANLMVQTTAPVPSRQLTPPVKGKRDVMAAWSPDGRELIFTRVGNEKECTILMMPSSGGEARTLGRCEREHMTGYSWHPDGKRLVADGIIVSGDKPASMQVMDLTTGTWQPLRYEKGKRDIDMSPMYSPDGKWIAFQRNISLSDLWRMPASGGRPERLTRLKTNIFGLAWTPDSRGIVFAGYRDGNTYLMQLDVASRRVTDLGVSDAAYPSIAWKSPSLAFVLSTSSSLLYSLPLAGPGNGDASKPEQVFPSTGKDLLPSISPDGQQIAFVSDRSARTGLWWAQLGRPESLRWIEGFLPLPRYAPVWSSDSQRLLMVGRNDDRTNVYEVTPSTARVRKLPVPAEDPIHAEYMPDPARMLVVADQGAGRLGLVLYDSSVTPWRVLATIDDVVLARVDASRQRIVFTRPVRPGIWQADLDLKNPKLIAPKAGLGAGRRLVIAADGVWLAAADEDCGLSWVPIPPQAGRGAERCIHKEFLGDTNFSFDAQNRRLYFSSQRNESSDIGWMRLPTSRTP